MTILVGVGSIWYSWSIENAREEEYLETINKLVENADGYYSIGLYEEAANAYGELSIKLKNERDPKLYYYANYMQGECYIKLAIECDEKEDKVSNIKKAMVPMLKLVKENSVKENPYSGKLYHNLGYAYWFLSEYEEQGKNLIESIESYEKAIEIYDSDGSYPNEANAARLSKSRVEYMLNKIHKEIIK